MLASWVLPAVSANPAGAAAPRSNARTRSVAIWARVTALSGQNRSGSVRQPLVTPNSARRSMWGRYHASMPASAKLDSSTAGGSFRSRTRTSQTAIVQRFISPSGQNICSEHSVPSNTLKALSASIAG